jgi:hypothetical protein
MHVPHDKMQRRLSVMAAALSMVALAPATARADGWWGTCRGHEGCGGFIGWILVVVVALCLLWPRRRR